MGRNFGSNGKGNGTLYAPASENTYGVLWIYADIGSPKSIYVSRRDFEFLYPLMRRRHI